MATSRTAEMPFLRIDHVAALEQQVVLGLRMRRAGKDEQKRRTSYEGSPAGNKYFGHMWLYYLQELLPAAAAIRPETTITASR